VALVTTHPTSTPKAVAGLPADDCRSAANRTPLQLHALLWLSIHDATRRAPRRARDQAGRHLLFACDGHLAIRRAPRALRGLQGGRGLPVGPAPERCRDALCSWR
jgi:hypothetical protein